MPAQTRLTAEQVVKHFGMAKIPHEGPWFLQTNKSTDKIDGTLGVRYDTPHVAYTSIICLETRDDFSAMHRLVTDELWHFYLGDPLELLLLYPDGHGETVVLGPDILAGQRLQFLVPRGVWQGSRPLGGADVYSVVGDTLTPGFEYSDYEPGYRAELQKGWPEFSMKIAELTRDDTVTRPTNMTAKAHSTSMELTELAGRNAVVKSDQLSIARFRLPNDASVTERKNTISEEMIIVISGTAHLQIGDNGQSAGPGEVLRVPVGAKYSITSTGSQPLEAYAICAPAFTPEQHETGK